jgi:hypothetical protein
MAAQVCGDPQGPRPARAVCGVLPRRPRCVCIRWCVSITLQRSIGRSRGALCLAFVFCDSHTCLLVFFTIAHANTHAHARARARPHAHAHTHSHTHPRSRSRALACYSHWIERQLTTTYAAPSPCPDRTVRVWNLAKQQCVRTLKGHQGPVRMVRTIKDGRIVSCSDDGLVCVWETVRNTPITMQGHRGPVVCVEVIDETLVLSGGVDQTIRFWDLTDRSCLTVIHAHTGIVTALASLADGRVASASTDATVKVPPPPPPPTPRTHTHTPSAHYPPMLLSVFGSCFKK